MESPDLSINGNHKIYNGFTIEIETQIRCGVLSNDQVCVLKRYEKNNYETLVPNDYDEKIIKLVHYWINN